MVVLIKRLKVLASAVNMVRGKPSNQSARQVDIPPTLSFRDRMNKMKKMELVALHLDYEGRGWCPIVGERYGYEGRGLEPYSWGEWP